MQHCWKITQATETKGEGNLKEMALVCKTCYLRVVE